MRKKSKPIIAFRVDAGILTGTGHLIELVSLLNSLRKRLDFEALAIVNDHELCRIRLAAISDDTIFLSNNMSLSEEIETMQKILSDREAALLITDLLSKPNSFYSSLRGMTQNTCVIFDNELHQATDASIVINFSILQNHNFYNQYREGFTKYFIGPQFALIDESLYSTWSKHIRFHKDVKRIVVNQGGSDPYCYTAKILRGLRMSKITQEILVIIGGACSRETRQEIERERSLSKENFIFFENISSEQMYNLMYKADMAITAAGNFLYELSFFGIPSLTVCHHDNHYRVAECFEKLGCVVNLGIGKDLNEEVIAKAVTNLIGDVSMRHVLFEKSRRVVDGYGTGRVADALVPLCQ